MAAIQLIAGWVTIHVGRLLRHGAAAAALNLIAVILTITFLKYCRSCPKKIVSISNFLSRLSILKMLSLRWMRSAPPIIDAARLVSVMVHDADAVDPQVTLDFLATAQERFEHRDIKFGASVYSVELAELLVRAGNCDVIQASVNILDQRFLTENMQKIFTDHGVELMARSVFLQGLLVDLPMAKMHFKQFGKRDILDLHSWFAEKNVNPSRACLNFVSNHQAVDSVVLGFASSDQVHGAAKAISEEIKLLQELQEMASNDSTIIDAREW